MTMIDATRPGPVRPGQARQAKRSRLYVTLAKRLNIIEHTARRSHAVRCIF